MKFQREQYEYQKAQAEASPDNPAGGGDNPQDLPQTKDVDADIKKQCATFTSNISLGNYLDGLENSGAITAAEADALYAMYADNNEKFIDGGSSYSYRDMVLSTNGWSVDDDGGTNWFWGVDNNAIVIAPNGEKIRLDNLVDKLVDEGMSKKEAKDKVKTLQKNLNI